VWRAIGVGSFATSVAIKDKEAAIIEEIIWQLRITVKRVN